MVRSPKPSASPVASAAAAATALLLAGTAALFLLTLRKSQPSSSSSSSSDDNDDQSGAVPAASSSSSRPSHSQQQQQNQQRRAAGGSMRSRFRSTTLRSKAVRVICAPTLSEYNLTISECLAAVDAHDADANADESVLVVSGTDGGTKSSDGGVEVAAQALQRGGNERPPAAKSSRVAVYRGDVYDLPALLRCVDSHHPGDDASISTICLDASNIYGNDIYADTVALVRYLRAVFEPRGLRTVIVKSRMLARHAKAFRTFEGFVRDAEDGGGSGGGGTKSSSGGGVGVGVGTGTGTGGGGGQEDVQVICAIGVTDYRKTIPLIVREGDRCLEIGCHHGKTTFLLAEQAAAGAAAATTSTTAAAKAAVSAAQSSSSSTSTATATATVTAASKDANDEPTVIGIDIGKVCIDRANQEQERRRQQQRRTKDDAQKKKSNDARIPSSSHLQQKHPECRFEVGDAWDTSYLLRLDGNLDVIYLDVGGISGADGEMEALALVRQLVCAYASSASRREDDADEAGTSSGGSSSGRRRRLRCIVVKSRCLRQHAATWVHSDEVLRERGTVRPSARSTGRVDGKVVASSS